MNQPSILTQSQPFICLIRYLLVSFFTPPCYVHSCFSWKKVPIRCKLPIFFTVSYKACPLSSPWGVIIQKLAGCKYLLSPQHILVDTISYIIHGLLWKDESSPYANIGGQFCLPQPTNYILLYRKYGF